MIAKKSLMVAALGLSATLMASSAYAGGSSYVLCHNIGGPRDLGANCDGTGNCSVALEGGEVLNVGVNEFLGIIIGASENAWAAHLAHGDGFATRVFDPPLHLASEIGPHEASNVECLARRATTEQPPEPGN